MPLYHWDMEWFKAIHLGWHSRVLDPFFTFFSYLGLGEVEGFIAIGLIIYKKTRAYGVPLLITVLSTIITSQLPKHLIPRDRPSWLAIAHPQEAWLANSFPSGHTTASFAFAFMLLFLTMGTKRAWIGWAALPTALLVGISRIYRGVHWPSDVVAGIFFGCITASLVWLVMHFMNSPLPGHEETGEGSGEEPRLGPVKVEGHAPGP